MLSTNSPLESLAAFSLVFMSGILLAVGFTHYVNQIQWSWRLPLTSSNSIAIITLSNQVSLALNQLKALHNHPPCQTTCRVIQSG
ncbi:MAG: hypothetical protein HYZ65_15595 [Burkholderiales bacterium]|nr:hypothetical protein [Burkholderiales bacterium]